MFSRLHRTAFGLFAVALIASCVSTRAQVTLAQPILMSPASVPYHISTGDLNRDGRNDIVMAFNMLGKVGVIFNNGNGNYTTGPSYTVGSYPVCVAIGELTNDLYMDIAVANKTSNNVTVLKGSSTGAFTPYQTVGVTGLTGASNPVWLAIADITKDGKNDIVTANSYDKSISVLINTGSTFTVTTSAVSSSALGTGGRPTCMALGDFNKDSKWDVAISTSAGNTVAVLKGNGLGAFPATDQACYPAGTNTSGLAVGDLNGDTYLDLVVTNDNLAGGVYVLMAQGTSGFATAVQYETFSGPKYVALTDLDWDGAPDIVTCQSGTPDLSIFVNRGNGTFLDRTQFSTNDKAKNGLASADMDNDGLSDILMIQNDVRLGVCNNLTPKLESIALNPPTTAVGNAVLGTVNLNRPAPPEGARIALTCTNPAVINVPTTFTVPGGSTTGTFVMAAQAVGTATVTGTFNRKSFSDSTTVTAVDQPSVWPGDVNNDGKVDVTDITIVARMSGGLDSIQWTPAD